MSRPRLIETKKFGGCRDRDSSRLKKFEDVETETDRDSSKGVETETETESLATHWMEDNRQWKTTFDGRQPSMEEDLQWKMTNKGRMIMGEVSLQKSFSYWKAHGAGHIPHCGIFLKGFQEFQRCVMEV